MTHVTQVFHRMCPKQYLSLWYVQRKPCSYLTSTLTPSKNGMNEIPQDPRHLGDASGASKTISDLWYVQRKPCTYIASTLTPSPNGPNEIPHDPRHRMRPKQYMSLWYVQHKPCTCLTSTLTPSPNRPNDFPHDPRHLGVPSGASKMISEPMVRLAQTMHLSYINTNTISKRTEQDLT